MHGVLARYGACAEVVTDGGGEFKDEFDELLVKAMIDHRVTSPNHPQANGAAERMVKTIKAGIDRYVSNSADEKSWDMYAPYVAMGYRITPQESTKMSPYELMFACKPELPTAHKEKLLEPLNFDDPELAAQSVLERAKLLEDFIPMAGRNILIARHRDTLRYAKLRSGGYLPSVVKFTVGQFVYVKDGNDSLHVRARPEILRVVAVKASGVLVLVGKCGTTISVNAVNCAPCHRTIKDQDESPDIEAFRPQKDYPCAVCRLPDVDRTMILCDSCNRGFHYYCLTPPLSKLPTTRTWVCPQCITAGVDPSLLKTLRQAEVSKYRRSSSGGSKRQSAAAAQPVRSRSQSPARVTRSTVQKPPSPPVVPTSPSPPQKRGPGRPRKHPIVNTVSALASFDWATLQGVGEALQVLMPGEWDEYSVAHLAKVVRHQSPVPRQHAYIRYPVIRSEIDTLLRSVDFSYSPSIIDICAGSGDLSHYLRSLQYSVVSNSASVEEGVCHDYHYDALQPATYKKLMSEYGSHVIIATPMNGLVDVIVPLAVLYAQHFACCRVPCSYLNDRLLYPARDEWLRRLQNQRRLLVIYPTVSYGGSLLAAGCVWLVVFASQEFHKQLALRD